MGRRATIIDAMTSEYFPREDYSKQDLDEWEFRGACRPYHDPRLRHERMIDRSPNGRWRIKDRIESTRPHRVTSWLHLSQETTIERRAPFLLAITHAGKRYQLEAFGFAELELIHAAPGRPEGWYFPEFGRALPGWAIRCTVEARPAIPFGVSLTPEASTLNQ